MKTRVVICGGRDFDDRKLCFEALDSILAGEDEVEVVSGHANGADALGEEYARANGLEITVFKPDWKRYGKGAGLVRNRQMVDYARETDGLVVAFWDGESRGTKSTIDYSRKCGLETRIVSY